MKKLFISLMVLGLLAFARPALAQESEQCLDVAGHWTQGEWIDTTYKCADGFVENGDMCHEWIVDIARQDTPYVCQSGYHLHDGDSWNHKCHKDWALDRAPVCPSTYGWLNGQESTHTCSKMADNSHWGADVDKVVDVEGRYEDVWVGDTYKDCDYPEEVTCPIDCGQAASEVANGEGGTKVCDATPACEVPVVPFVKEKGFEADHRCHGLTPLAVTWAAYDPTTSTLNWSAVGGDKVELKFGWAKDVYPYSVVLANDGHEKVGLGTQIGYWFNWYEMRTVNGCKKGPWTFFN